MNPQKSYAFFCLWFIAVSITLGYFTHLLYVHEFGVLSTVQSSLLNPIGITLPKLPTQIGTSLYILFVALVWWRVIKVTVFMGAPFKFGMRISNGRQDGIAGRLVNFTYIGEEPEDPGDKGLLLFGAVFRAHPNSDKLVRMRLEWLLLALPYKSALVINESRLYLKIYDNDTRWELFNTIVKPYIKELDDIQQALVENTDRIAREIHLYRRTFDGLTWHISSSDLSGYVIDSFGHRLNFKHIAKGRYRVTGFIDDPSEVRRVESVNELRIIAQSELNNRDIIPEEGDDEDELPF